MDQRAERFWKLGLIGYPLGHSHSPRLHQAALDAYQLQGEYRLYAIPPTPAGEGEILEIITAVKGRKMDGLNVTIPHKQTALKFVDQLTPTAAAVGAVNTIAIDSAGALVGDNTDVPGFMMDLSRLYYGSPGKALVLGAGGSARAVVYGLLSAGWLVTILARRVEQARELASQIETGRDFRKKVVTGFLDKETLKEASQDVHLLVNTTPLGMHPNIEDCPWPRDLDMPATLAIYDLVYNPAETLLLQRARAAGLPSRNGAGMLIAQAALAFSLWTGLEPPFQAMEKAFPFYKS